MADNTTLLREIRTIVAEEIRPAAVALTSLTRQVDRIETRLAEVEEHTRLIPGIAEAVGANSRDIDDHEKRLKKLEQEAA